MMGIALDFLTGLTNSELLKSMLPKIELPLLLPLSNTRQRLLIELDGLCCWNGLKTGASGRNLGPDAEKLNSLWPGEKCRRIDVDL